jgi:hypothetical protein
MIYYILKKKEDYTRIQLNASGVRIPENGRCSPVGNCIVKVTKEIAKAHFMEDRWYTLEEIRIETQKPEWTSESASFWLKACNLIGLA